MNYAGKFDGAISSEGPGSHSHFVHLNPGHVHAPADAIVVPDAHFLFNADFKRSGVDLILSGDDRELVLHDYFKGEKHKALASPDGAHLTGDLVNALAGYIQVSQAGGADASANHVIGHVTKLAGSATVIRNGVSIILNNGDNVEKGDVVQSGSNSTVGITFIDGTVFGLSSNARMVLNDMVYDPNGSNNSSLLSLVAGTVTFVAGDTAKHGDMKIDTPVATMGIRGTAVLVEIDFSVPGANGEPNASFQVLVEPDGTTGSYILFDKTTLQPLAIVNQAGQQININNGVISQTQVPLSPDIQKLITDVFQQKFTDNTNNNTKTASAFGSSTPDNGQQITFQQNGTTATGIVQTAANTTQTNSASSGNGSGGQGPTHLSGTLTLTSLGLSGPQTTFGTSEITGHTGDKFSPDHVGGTLQYTDLNPADQPVVTADFTSVTYTNAKGSFVIGAGQTTPTSGLSSLQFADIMATVTKLLLVPGGNNANNGTVTWLYSVPDNQFDFLANGETLTFTYHATATVTFNGVTEPAAVDLTVVVQGTNDQPIITTDHVPQKIAFSGGTSTSSGPLVSGDATSGTFAFTDVDLTDKHSVSTALKSATMSDGSNVPSASLATFAAALSASIGTDSSGTGKGIIDWQLADLSASLASFIPTGQTLTLTYTVTLTDGQGGTDTKTVQVTITNQSAEVWVHTAGDGSPDSLWTTGQNWSGGTRPGVADDVIIITNQSQGLVPTFPAIIDASTDAVANSVTLNDFSTSLGDRPELDNFGTLTIGTTLSLGSNSILHNSGTINVGTKIELLDDGVVLNASELLNTGTLNLAQGGDFEGHASVTNSGIIEVQGGVLNVLVDVMNFVGAKGGDIIIDSGAKLVLGTDPNDSGITGGTVNVHGGGELDLTDGSILNNGQLINNGQVNVTGIGNTFSNETVSNTGTASAIDITGSLTADTGTTITNTDASSGETVESTGSLTLQDTSSISGGRVTNKGALNLQGTSSLNGGSLINTGQVNVTGTGNVLDGEIVSNSGGASAIDITGTLTAQTGTTIANQDATSGETIESGGKLTLADTSSISGGQVTNAGTLTLSGTAALNGNGSLTNTGQVNVSGTGNALDGETVSNTGNGAAIDISGALVVKDGTAITNTTTSSGETIESGGSLTLQNASSISGGQVTNNGFLDLQTSSSLSSGALDNTATVEVDSGPGYLIGETVTNAGTILANFGGFLILASGTTVTNTGNSANVTVAGNGVLTVDNSSISGGQVTNIGEVDLQGNATLGSGAFDNWGFVHVFNANNIFDGEAVTNEGGGGHFEVSGELILKDNTGIANSAFNNAETVDFGSTLTLQDTSSISGGQVTVWSGGTLNLQGTSGLSSGKLTNTGQVNVSGSGNSLTGEQVLNTGTASAIDITGTLTAQTGTTIANQDATSGETIESGGKLTLADTSSISGGQVTNKGTLNLQGTTASLSSGKLTNTGQVNVSGSNNSLTGEQVLNTGTASAIDITGTLTAQTGTTIANQDATSGETIESGGKLTLADTSSISGGQVTNKGTLNLQGTTASLSSGKLTNTGQVNVSGSDNSLTGEQVLNTGTASAIDITGTLTAQTGTTIANQDATSGETIESGGKLTLADTSSISGGQVTNKGTLVLSGTTASLSSGKLTNTGQVNVSGSGNSLTGEQVLNTGTASAIDITGTLTAQTGTTIANQDATSGETIESGGKLTLADTSSISGGQVTNKGTLNLQGTTASLSSGKLTNTGQVNVSGSNNSLTGEQVLNTGTASAIDITGTLTAQTGTTIANQDATSGETIESGGKLTLADTSSISGGQVTNKGTLNLQGTTASLSSGKLTNTGQVNVSGSNNSLTGEQVLNTGTASAIDITGTLTAQTGTTIANQDATSGETIESGGKLTLADTSSISGGQVTNKGTLVLSGTTASLSSGKLTNTGQVNVSGSNNSLTGEQVLNTGTASAIDITGTLTAQTGTTIANQDATSGETIESGGKLTLADTSSISGGQVTNKGTLNLQGTSGLSERQADQHRSGQRLRERQQPDRRAGAQHRDGLGDRYHGHADGADRDHDCQPGCDERGDHRERRQADAGRYLVDLGRAGHQQGDAEPSGYDGVAVERQADQHRSGQRLRERQQPDRRAGAQHRHGLGNRHYGNADGADRDHDCQPGCDERGDHRERRQADAGRYLVDLGRAGHQQGDAGSVGHDGVAVERQADQHRSGQRLRQQQQPDRRAGAQHRDGLGNRHYGNADGADRDHDCQPGCDERGDHRERRQADACGHLVDLGRAGHQQGDAEPSGYDGVAVERQADQHRSGQRLRQQQQPDRRAGAQHRDGLGNRHYGNADGADGHDDRQPGCDERGDHRERRQADAGRYLVDLGRAGHQQGDAEPSGHDGVAVERQADQHRSGQRLRQQQQPDRRAGAQHRDGLGNRHYGNADGADRDHDCQPGCDERGDHRERRQADAGGYLVDLGRPGHQQGDAGPVGHDGVAVERQADQHRSGQRLRERQQPDRRAGTQHRDGLGNRHYGNADGADRDHDCQPGCDERGDHRERRQADAGRYLVDLGRAGHQQGDAEPSGYDGVAVERQADQHRSGQRLRQQQQPDRRAGAQHRDGLGNRHYGNADGADGHDDCQPGCDERGDHRERRQADACGHLVDLGRAGHQQGDAEPSGYDGVAVERQADQHRSGQRLRQQQQPDRRAGAQHRDGLGNRHYGNADGADRDHDCQPGCDERGDHRERRQADAGRYLVDLGRAGHQQGDAEPSGHDGVAVERQADQHRSGQRLRQQQQPDRRAGAQHRDGLGNRHYGNADGADGHDDCQPGCDERGDHRERRQADAGGHLVDLGRAGHQQGDAEPSGHDGVAVERQADQHRSGQRLRQQQQPDRRAGSQHRHGLGDRYHGHADGADRDHDRQPGCDERGDHRERRQADAGGYLVDLGRPGHQQGDAGPSGTTASLSSGKLTNTGQVNVSGSNNSLTGEQVLNTGTASAIDITGTLTAQTGTTIANQDATSGETIESGGKLTLADTSSISGGQVTNKGTLNLQGTTASLSSGKLTNTGQVNVSGSNNSLTGEQVLNTGTASAIDITGTLTAQTGTTIANQDATSGETIESGGKLTLADTSSISGGQVTNKGTLNLQGTTASLSSGKLTNTGQVNVSGSGNSLTGEQVLNTGTASAIDITGTLTAQTGTTIANQDATSGETIESGGKLTLADTSSISGGQVTNRGTLVLRARRRRCRAAS